MIDDKELNMLLDTYDEMGIEYVTFPAHTFLAEYALCSDDKDYVTFHKGEMSPNIVDKLVVCDYNTTKEPIYKDWYMSINYHS